jgi:hypothetical protein
MARRADDPARAERLNHLASYLRARVPEEAGERDGVGMIAAERQRQVDVEGWTPEHDDEHEEGELCGAGASYADFAHRQLAAAPLKLPLDRPPSQTWRWSGEWWKPSEDVVRNLVKAGALIAAEIDRLRRVSPLPEAER